MQLLKYNADKKKCMKYQKMRSGAKPLFFWHMCVLFPLWCTLVKQEAFWFPVFCPDSSQCCACFRWWRLRGCSWGNSYAWGKVLLTYAWGWKGELRSGVGVQRWKSKTEQSRGSQLCFPLPSTHRNAHESSLCQFRPVAEAHTAVLQPLFLPSPLKQMWDSFCHWVFKVQEVCHH